MAIKRSCLLLPKEYVDHSATITTSTIKKKPTKLSFFTAPNKMAEAIQSDQFVDWLLGGSHESVKHV